MEETASRVLLEKKDPLELRDHRSFELPPRVAASVLPVLPVFQDQLVRPALLVLRVPLVIEAITVIMDIPARKELQAQLETLEPRAKTEDPERQAEQARKAALASQVVQGSLENEDRPDPRAQLEIMEIAVTMALPDLKAHPVLLETTEVQAIQVPMAHWVPREKMLSTALAPDVVFYKESYQAERSRLNYYLVVCLFLISKSYDLK